MPKNLFVDPQETLAPGKITFVNPVLMQVSVGK